jgi:3-(methylthio)propanoyl-CoA dehydrogenase
MTMRALTQATRAVAYVTAAAMDRAHASTEATDRAAAQAFVDFMIPIACGT